MSIVKKLGKFLGRHKKKKSQVTSDETENQQLEESQDSWLDKVLTADVSEVSASEQSSRESFLRLNSAAGDEPSKIKYFSEFSKDSSENNDFLLPEDSGVSPTSEDTLEQKIQPEDSGVSNSEHTLQQKEINLEYMKSKILLLLEEYLNSKEDSNTVVKNREELKKSVLNFIDSFTLMPTEIESKQSELKLIRNDDNEKFVESSGTPMKSASKKNNLNESSMSINFLSSETRSISFNLDKNGGGESIVSVINAIRSEFLKITCIESGNSLPLVQQVINDAENPEARLKEVSEVKNLEKSDSRLSCTNSSIDYNCKRQILDDRDHLNNMFDYLCTKISSLIGYEKETFISLGEIILDLKQFCSLVDLFNQWTNHKLDKVSSSIVNLQTNVTNMISSKEVIGHSQRKLKIILVRKTTSNIL